MFGNQVLLLLIVIIKLPFIEAGIFFNNQSVWKSTKSSFEYTQNNVLKVTLLLATMVLFSYVLLFKVSYIITPISTAHKSLAFFLGLITSNFEILGKLLIISLFLKIPKQSNDNAQSV